MNLTIVALNFCLPQESIKSEGFGFFASGHRRVLRSPGLRYRHTRKPVHIVSSDHRACWTSGCSVLYVATILTALWFERRRRASDRYLTVSSNRSNCDQEREN